MNDILKLKKQFDQALLIWRLLVISPFILSSCFLIIGENKEVFPIILIIVLSEIVLLFDNTLIWSFQKRSKLLLGLSTYVKIPHVDISKNIFKLEVEFNQLKIEALNSHEKEECYSDKITKLNNLNKEIAHRKDLFLRLNSAEEVFISGINLKDGHVTFERSNGTKFNQKFSDLRKY